MSNRSEIIDKVQTYFAGTDVRRVSLFGSIARGELGTDSDVDLLMELDHPIGYLKIIEHKQALEDILKKKVDLLTTNGISPKIRPYIQPDLMLIYEKPG